MNDESVQLDREQAVKELAGAILDFAADRRWTASHEDLMDILWMAAHLPGEVFRAAPIEDPATTTPGSGKHDPRGASAGKLPDDIQTEPSMEDGDEDAEVDKENPEDPGRKLDVFPYMPGGGLGSPSARLVSLPSPPAIPDRRAFLKLWRPLMARGPSRTRWQLDVEGTARRWVEERLPEFVFRPARERQVELVLILDHGPSMDMWRSAMGEVADLFRSCGGFRRVTIACLLPEGKGFRLVRPADLESPDPSPVRLNAHSNGIAGRLLYVIVSDCISSHWRFPASITLTENLCRQGAVMLAQVLPERLWTKTALGLADSYKTHGGAYLMPNRFYRTATDSDATIHSFERKLERPNRTAIHFADALLPTLSLFESIQASRVVEFLRGSATAPLKCYRLQVSTIETVWRIDALKALEAFGDRGSETARQLATLLAASPAISLPLARIIGLQFLGPDAGRLAAAEVWMSGLLETIEEVHLRADPEQVLYRFRPGIQQRLLDAVPPSLRQRIIEVSSQYIEQNFGRLTGLSAMLADPNAHRSALGIGLGSDPIARIAADILRRQGPEYAALVNAATASGAKRLKRLAMFATAFAYAGFGPCHHFAWSPDGSTLAISHRDGTLRLRHFKGAQDQAIQLDRLALNQVAWFGDGRRIAVACFARVVIVLDALLRPILRLGGHNSDVTTVAVSSSPTRALIASGTAGGTVRLWDSESGRLIALHNLTRVGMVRALRWLTPDLLIAGYEQRTLVFECTASGLRVLRDLDLGGTAVAVVQRDSATWPPSREPVVALGQPTGEIQLLNSGSWEKIASIFAHRSLVTSIDASPDGRLLASKSLDGSVTVVRIRSARMIGTLNTSSDRSPYSGVAFRPATQTLAVARDSDREIALYDTAKLTAPANPLCVRVAGSFQSVNNREEFGRACQEIGRAVAMHGHTLVISSAKTGTADFDAFVGYINARPPNGGRVIFSGPNQERVDNYIDTLERFISQQKMPVTGIAGLLVSTLNATSLTTLLVHSGVVNMVSPSSITRLNDFLSRLGDDDVPALLKEATTQFPDNRALCQGLTAILHKQRRVVLHVDRVDRPKWDAIAHARVFANVDGVIVIGGGNRTRVISQFAEAYDIPWIPVAAFGGTAANMIGWASASPIDSDKSHMVASLHRLDSKNEVPAFSDSSWNEQTAGTALKAIERLSSVARARTNSLPVCHLTVRNAVGSEGFQSSAIGVFLTESILLTAAHCLSPIDHAVSDRLEVEIVTQPRSRAIATFEPGLPDAWTLRRHPGHDYGLLVRRPAEDVEALSRAAPIEFAERLAPNDPARVFVRGVDGVCRAIHGVVQSISSDLIELWLDGQLSPGESGAPIFVAGPGPAPLLAGIVGAATSSDLISTGSDPYQYSAATITWAKLERSIRNPLSPEPATSPEAPAASEFAPTKPEHWILVAGTGEFELPAVQWTAARSLGEALAAANLGLITGGWQGVDHVTAREFVVGLRAKNRSPEAWLRHVLPRGRTPSYSEGRADYVEPGNEYAQALAGADAVVLIGGLGGTANVGDSASAAGTPVFPLANTGGDAKAAHRRLLDAWDRLMYAGVSRDEFKELLRRDAALRAVKLIGQLLQARKRGGTFLSEAAVGELIGRQCGANETTRAMLLLLRTEDQQTWLVATSHRFFCLLGDACCGRCNSVGRAD